MARGDALTAAASGIALVALAVTTLTSQADEWRETVERLQGRAVVSGLAPVLKDGKVVGLELTRGVLQEDDGPAAGFSYRPNEERLDAKTTIRKQLIVEDPRAAQAYLLIAPGGKLEARINGSAIVLQPRGKAGNYWEQYEISPDALKQGLNTIELNGQGKVWIARDDERPQGDPPPRRSAKSVDQGATWSEQLGPKGAIAGEYYVRVYLEQHQPHGIVTLPVLDVLNLDERPIAAELATPVTDAPVTIRVQATKKDSHNIALAVRSGATWVPNREWSDWQNIAVNAATTASGEVELTAMLPRPHGRFVQVRFEMTTENRSSSPQLTSVVVSRDGKTMGDARWSQRRTLSVPEHPIVRAPFEFAHERYDHAVLKQLREEHQLDRLIESATDDLERLKRLAAWSSQRWQKGHLGEIYPPWNALEILKVHRDGTPVGGFCQQYNVLFLQACQSVGFVGRAVSIGPGEFGSKIRSGHEVVEIWSDQFRKWIYIDGDAAWLLVDAKSGTPLSLRKLRERQLSALREQSHEPVDVMPIPLTDTKPRYEWKGLTSFPAFVELRLIPRSNFLSQASPLPLNQGMRGWFWPGHVVWTDEASPAARLYGQRVSIPSNWDWTANQVEARLFATAQPDELLVQLDHNAPDFEYYVVRSGSSTATAEIVKGSSYLWRVKGDSARLTIQSMNRAGRTGSPTTITVE